MGPPADTLWDSTSTDISGDFSVSLVTGTYDVQISPTIPYPETTLVGIDVVKDSTVTVDVKLTPASLLIMDDDEGKNYESYYTSSLDSIGVSYILWDVSSEGVFTIGIMRLFGSPIIISFTGDPLTNSTTQQEVWYRRISGRTLVTAFSIQTTFILFSIGPRQTTMLLMDILAMR